MSSGGDAIGIAITLFAVNVIYLIITFVLAWILGTSPVDLFAGAFGDVALTGVFAWAAVGAIIGIADLYAILSFVNSVSGGSRY